MKSEHDEEVDQLHVSHDTAIAQVHNKLEQTWKDWHKERDGLRAEIRALNEKVCFPLPPFRTNSKEHSTQLNNFRAIHEERQKEAQNLGRQLMSLMSGAGKPDLAGLLGGTMNSPSIDALSEQAPIYSDEITIPNGHPQGAIPVRRKSSEHNCDNEDDNPTHAKRAKTTHQSPTALARQGHIKLKVAKTPHRRSDGNLAKRKAGVEVDEMVKETPISPTETNYGTAPVLTSTPKGFLGQYGLGGRRKTMPLFPSTAVADDNDDENDIEEEEALRGAARDVAWDETTMD